MRFRMITITALVLAGCGAAGSGAVPSAQPSTQAGGVQTLQRTTRADAATYSVVLLATLRGSSAGGSAINDRGQVSGYSALADGPNIHAAVWTGDAQPVDLGTLGGPNSAVVWPGINERGEVAGISETATLQPRGEIFSCAKGGFFPQQTGHECRGFVWRDGTMTPLPTLGGDNGFATGINARGQVVGWAENSTVDPTCVAPQVLQFEPVIWDTRIGKTEQLPLYPGDVDGAATGINAEGQVVGISGICDKAVGRFSAAHAVLWDHGAVTYLGSLGGVAWNTPMALNDRGQVVGFADLPDDRSGTPNFHAFLWTKSGGMHDLKTLPGDVYSQATGINERGQVVGVSSSAGFATSRAVIWQDGQPHDLNGLIPPNSGLALLYANDINDRGEVTGGACVLVKGACGAEVRAFRATPIR